MKLLFCYDGPMAVDKDGNAFPQTFTQEVFSRYYSVASSLTMITRTRLIESDKTNIPKANMDRLKIVSCPNLASIKGKLIGRYGASKILYKEIEATDYIIARLPSNIGELAIEIAKKMSKPYLVEVVACRWDTLWYHSLKGKVIAPLSFYKTKKVIRNAEAVMYITEEFLQSRYPTKGQSFVCSDVLLKSVKPSILENRFEHIDNMGERKKISLASIGAINMSYKGHNYMIKALSILVKSGYDVEYHIVGGGNGSRLKKLADELGVGDRLFLYGALPHDEVFKFLDSVDIYIQPSLAEAQGRSLIEAMSRACPCICTDVGGMPELIEKQFIVEKRDPISIANKIIQILDSDMKAIASRNFQYANNNFAKRIINAKYTEIYDQIFIKKFTRGF